MKTAIVIRHIAFEDLGTLAAPLGERGYDIRYVEAGQDDIERIHSARPDLLVVLGGPMGVYESERYPFVRAELRVLEARLAADLPTLGICLGAQLIAHALGSEVFAGPHKEIGWHPVQLTPAGAASALAPLEGGAPVFHWHGDTFTLPLGAERLAATELYENQAFSFGRACLGLQFHPEVTAQGLEHWYVGHADELAQVTATAGLSVETLRRDAAAFAGALEARAARLWTHWLAAVEPAPGA